MALPREAIALETVRRVVGEVRDVGRTIGPDERLADDLGLTSFDMMVVCVRLEAEAGTTLDFARLADAATVGDLARILC